MHWACPIASPVLRVRESHLGSLPQDPTQAHCSRCTLGERQRGCEASATPACSTFVQRDATSRHGIAAAQRLVARARGSTLQWLSACNRRCGRALFWPVHAPACAHLAQTPRPLRPWWCKFAPAAYPSMADFHCVRVSQRPLRSGKRSSERFAHHGARELADSLSSFDLRGLQPPAGHDFGSQHCPRARARQMRTRSRDERWRGREGIGVAGLTTYRIRALAGRTVTPEALVKHFCDACRRHMRLGEGEGCPQRAPARLKNNQGSCRFATRAARPRRRREPPAAAARAAGRASPPGDLVRSSHGRRRKGTAPI